jgi:hypothetical protein
MQLQLTGFALVVSFGYPGRVTWKRVSIGEPPTHVLATSTVQFRLYLSLVSPGHAHTHTHTIADLRTNTHTHTPTDTHTHTHTHSLSLSLSLSFSHRLTAWLTFDERRRTSDGTPDICHQSPPHARELGVCLVCCRKVA